MQWNMRATCSFCMRLYTSPATISVRPFQGPIPAAATIDVDDVPIRAEIEFLESFCHFEELGQWR